VARQVDGFLGVGRTRASDDAGATGRQANAQLYHMLVLVQIHAGAFARRAHRHDAVNPCGDLTLEQFGECGFVHVSVTKWCDQGGDHALEQGGGHETNLACVGGTKDECPSPLQ